MRKWPAPCSSARRSFWAAVKRQCRWWDGENRALGERLALAAKTQEETLILQFTAIEADRNPGAAWEVYVGLPAGAKPDAESPNFVGNVALFGDGIKGEGHHPAQFTFALNRALRASADPSALQVTFVPTSGIVVDGRPVPAEVRAPVRIGEVNILVEKKRAGREISRPEPRAWPRPAVRLLEHARNAHASPSRYVAHASRRGGCRCDPLWPCRRRRRTTAATAARAPACGSQMTHADSLPVIATVPLPADGLVLGNARVSLRLTAPLDRAATLRLAAAVRDEGQTVLLQLKCVQADSPPQASWEVYVGTARQCQTERREPLLRRQRRAVGDGIKSQPQGEAFAQFVFPLDRAIEASAGASALTLTFVPSSGVVVDGRPVPAAAAAPVRIGAANLLLDGPPARR